MVKKEDLDKEFEIRLGINQEENEKQQLMEMVDAQILEEFAMKSGLLEKINTLIEWFNTKFDAYKNPHKLELFHGGNDSAYTFILKDTESMWKKKEILFYICKTEPSKEHPIGYWIGIDHQFGHWTNVKTGIKYEEGIDVLKGVLMDIAETGISDF